MLLGFFSSGTLITVVSASITPSPLTIMMRASAVFAKYKKTVQHPCRPSPTSCNIVCVMLSNTPGVFTISMRFFLFTLKFNNVAMMRLRASVFAAKAILSSNALTSRTSLNTDAIAGRTPTVQQSFILFSSFALNILRAPHAFLRRVANALSMGVAPLRLI